MTIPITKHEAVPQTGRRYSVLGGGGATGLMGIGNRGGGGVDLPPVTVSNSFVVSSIVRSMLLVLLLHRCTIASVLNRTMTDQRRLRCSLGNSPIHVSLIVSSRLSPPRNSVCARVRRPSGAKVLFPLVHSHGS